jgi:uncharacterized protein
MAPRGHRGADREALRGLPAARRDGHHLRQQARPRGPRPAKSRPELTCVHKDVSHNHAELQQRPRLYPVQRSFSAPIEIQANLVTDSTLPIETKMDFEWDEAKRLSNIKERGVDFRDAALIFDGAVIAKEDTRENYGEQRFRALGRVDDEFYVVAYTRRGSVLRIISAWKVDEDGRKRYEEILSR